MRTEIQLVQDRLNASTWMPNCSFFPVQPAGPSYSRHKSGAA
jgi:hypothetical protein